MALKHLLQPAGLHILMYHRVLSAPDRLRPGDPTVDDFRAQMRVLRRWFEPVDLLTGARQLADGTLPPRAVAVTFDDGYRDNLTLAAPVLREFGVPATVFVASGYLDGDNMWNDLLIEAVRQAPGQRIDLGDFALGQFQAPGPAEGFAALRPLLMALKPLPPARRQAAVMACAHQCGAAAGPPLMLSTTELRTLAQSGVRIGAHTVTHPILATLDDAEAAEEIAQSKARLAEIIDTPIDVFAYPNGRPALDYTPRDAATVEALGFACAVSTRPALATPGCNPWELPRYGLWSHHAGRFGVQLAKRFVSEGTDLDGSLSP